MKILGISAYYHDAAAALIDDGSILAAAQEERFSRVKNDARFPARAIEFCLRQANTKIEELQAVVYYDKPFVTFERLLSTYLEFAPRGLRSFTTAMPIWLKEKLFLRRTLTLALKEFGTALPPLLFSEHHQSHAAAAFYPSPFEDAAVLCLDGVGEWATTSAWHGKGNRLDPLWELEFPHSLGLLYSAFTAFTGFKVNSGEYKVMGLAPYGKPVYYQKILDELIDLKADGTFRMNLSFFDYCTGLRMTNSRFSRLFDGPARQPEGPLTEREMNLASSIQAVTEEVVLRLSRKIHADTGASHLCLGGGVALNCVANGRVLREGPFKKIWIQPAAGDAGSALGCALAAFHEYFDRPRRVSPSKDSMQGTLLGPQFTNAEITQCLTSAKIPYRQHTRPKLLIHVAQALSQNQVVGWFQGRMEFGPRALGSRSILADPRSEKMQSTLNLKIKMRESFRPFAPAVLSEQAKDYFDLPSESPYMMLLAPVKSARRLQLTPESRKLQGIALLNVPKSDIPAVTHVDYSARVQTVSAENNPIFYELLREFFHQTQCPVLVNTSFNVRGEPIVCTPQEALNCFLKTEMDLLVMGDFVVDKKDLA